MAGFAASDRANNSSFTPLPTTGAKRKDREAAAA
jgi:hypothetical protein